MKSAEPTPDFCVDQIDHVELTVPDRRVAAEWYGRVLGLTVIPEYAHWSQDPAGPLMIGTRQGNTKLALFEGNPVGSQKTIGFHLVAFRVGAKSFGQFVAGLEERKLFDTRNRIVTADHVVDHGKAFSIYFCDPFGHQLEITTYADEEARIALNRISG